MSTDLATARQEIKQRAMDAERLVRATAGGSLRGQRPRWRRVELRPVELKSGPHLQVVAYDERQSFTNNYPWGVDADQAVSELLAEPFGHWHVAGVDGEVGFRVSKSGRVLMTRSSTGQVRDLSLIHI